MGTTNRVDEVVDLLVALHLLLRLLALLLFVEPFMLFLDLLVPLVDL